MTGIFITGTDTGIGKTVVAAGLVYALCRQGVATAALKPVAAGCAETPGGLRNDDAELLRSLLPQPPPYERVNPCALADAAAPHLVAAEEGRTIDVDALAAAVRASARERFTVVEGAGGWRVPLDGGRDIAALAKASGLPALLVVGIRLGCLNHALLSAEAILRDGVDLRGWVAVELDAADTRRSAQVAALDERLPAPRLGWVPVLDDPRPEEVAPYLVDLLALAIR